MIDGEESDESEETPKEDRYETKIDKELLNVPYEQYEHVVKTMERDKYSIKGKLIKVVAKENCQ